MMHISKTTVLFLALLTLGIFAIPEAARAAGNGAGHADPFSFVLLQIGLVIVMAMVGKRMALALGQPAVLGELAIGVIVGNICYWQDASIAVLIMHSNEVQQILGLIWAKHLPIEEAATQVLGPAMHVAGSFQKNIFDILQSTNSTYLLIMGCSFWIFSNLGVILLLFVVGLESKISELLRVGSRATAVAIVGVVMPFLLGLGSGYVLFPEMSLSAHLFIAATLCATSVGITARVFKDMQMLQTNEAKIILGAAVLDDIMGLIILAVMSGIVITGEFSGYEAGRITLVSLLFLGAVVFLGEALIRRVIPVASWFDADKVKLMLPLALCCFLSWLANQIELATIVGAFAAGLILSDELFARHTQSRKTIEEVVSPIESIFAPMFFVLMGMQVNLATFSDIQILLAALLLTVAAIIGKAVSGVVAGKGVDKLSIGLGMVPRGEVGLIFAGIGRGLGVIDDALFSGLVIMIAITTVIAPPALNWSLARAKRNANS